MKYVHFGYLIATKGTRLMQTCMKRSLIWAAFALLLVAGSAAVQPAWAQQAPAPRVHRMQDEQQGREEERQDEKYQVARLFHRKARVRIA